MARYKSRQEVQLCRGNANSMPNPRQMEAVNPRDQTDANLGKHEKSQISCLAQESTDERRGYNLGKPFRYPLQRTAPMRRHPSPRAGTKPLPITSKDEAHQRQDRGQDHPPPDPRCRRAPGHQEGGPPDPRDQTPMRAEPIVARMRGKRCGQADSPKVGRSDATPRPPLHRGERHANTRRCDVPPVGQQCIEMANGRHQSSQALER